MKKTLMIVAVAVASYAHAVESYLYWLVPDQTSYKGTTLTGDYMAKAYAVPSSGEGAYLNLFDGTGAATSLAGGQGASVSFGGSADNVPYFADVSAYLDGYTYYIQLYNSQDALVATSDGLKYSADAVGAISGMGTPGTLWNVTFPGKSNPDSGSVPEPTSGLLTLLGVAGLALRRKRA